VIPALESTSSEPAGITDAGYNQKSGILGNPSLMPARPPNPRRPSIRSSFCCGDNGESPELSTFTD